MSRLADTSSLPLQSTADRIFAADCSKAVQSAIAALSPSASAQHLAAVEGLSLEAIHAPLRVLVIGEFSTGKSTLLNALLGEDLLATENLQGTTTFETQITHGAEIQLALNYKDRKTQVIRARPRHSPMSTTTSLNDKRVSHEEFVETVRRVTSTDSIGESLVSIRITHPSAGIPRGVVLCDTPGTNSNSQTHTNRTVESVFRGCDTAIVVSSATAALPQSQIQFLRDHLGEDINHAIFVITKLDAIRPSSERQRVMEFVGKRISASFQGKPALVLGCSPGVFIDHLDTTEPPATCRDHIHQFLNVRRILHHHFGERHTTLATLRALRPLSHSLSVLITEFAQARLDLHANLEAKEKRLQLRPIAPGPLLRIRWVSESQLMRSRRASSGMRSANLLVAELESSFATELSQAKEVGEIDTLLRRSLPSRLLHIPEDLLACWKAEFEAILARLSAVLRHTFDECQFPPETSVGKTRPVVAASLQLELGFEPHFSKLSDDFIQVAARLSERRNKLLAKKAAAAVGGAAVLGAIVPVLGHAAGAWLASSMVGPADVELLEEHRREARQAFGRVSDVFMNFVSDLDSWACQQMDVQLHAAFTEYLSRADAYFNDVAASNRGALLQEIDTLRTRLEQLLVVEHQLSRCQTECEARLAAVKNRTKEASP